MEISMPLLKYMVFKPHGKFVIGFFILDNINIGQSGSRLFISYEFSSNFNVSKLIKLQKSLDKLLNRLLTKDKYCKLISL